ncbi:MAG: Holliday junction resolvase RuvX [Bacteroidota bacterium]|jgi:putative Holliday junction resolvase
MRIISVDYGSKRCGIAVSDPLCMIANPLETVDTPNLFNFFDTYFKSNQVKTILVGMPKHLDGNLNDLEKHILNFIKQFAQKYPAIKVERLDERFTSKMAFQAMIDGGLKKKDRQNKSTIDRVSAAILLQNFLDHHQNLP